MTKPTTKTFGDFIVQIETTSGSGIFSAPCGLTSKGFNQTANTQTTVVPDCDDPDAPAYEEKAVDSIGAEISGSGVMATEAFTTWQDWFDSADVKACRIYPKGSGNGYYAGNFLLTAFNMTVDRGQKVQVSVTMQNDGQYTWTP